MGCNAWNHPPDCNCGWGGDTGSGDKEHRLASYGLPGTQSTHPAICPVCGANVFYYENDFGSKVWFDELGYPWPKHPCFTSDPVRSRLVIDSVKKYDAGIRYMAAISIGYFHLVEISSVSRFGYTLHLEDCIFITQSPLNYGEVSFIVWQDGACALQGDSDLVTPGMLVRQGKYGSPRFRPVYFPNAVGHSMYFLSLRVRTHNQ